MKDAIKFLVFFISCFSFLSCNIIKKTINRKRNVYMESGAYNVAYGENAIKIDEHSVQIDTSYYPKDFDTTYVKPNHLKRNRQFNCDIRKDVNSKNIYTVLLNTPMLKLKKIEKKSYSITSYWVQDVSITENEKTYILSFRIPTEEVAPSALNKFLLEFGSVFIFNEKNHSIIYCKDYYD